MEGVRDEEVLGSGLDSPEEAGVPFVQTVAQDGGTGRREMRVGRVPMPATRPRVVVLGHATDPRRPLGKPVCGEVGEPSSGNHKSTLRRGLLVLPTRPPPYMSLRTSYRDGPRNALEGFYSSSLLV